MNAKDFAKKYGKKAIGKVIMTEAMGYWPGGFATITGLTEDDPAIVLYVKSQHGAIGIFDYEEVELMPPLKGRTKFKITVKSVYEETYEVRATNVVSAEKLISFGQGKLICKPYFNCGLVKGCSRKTWEVCNVRGKCPLCRND